LFEGLAKHGGGNAETASDVDPDRPGEAREVGVLDLRDAVVGDADPLGKGALAEAAKFPELSNRVRLAERASDEERRKGRGA
jgi:hypothetical protein